MKKITKRCPKCGTYYQLGYNGMKGGCDKCLGIERDVNGEAWGLTEITQQRMDVETGQEFTLYRSQVFPPYSNSVL